MEQRNAKTAHAREDDGDDRRLCPHYSGLGPAAAAAAAAVTPSVLYSDALGNVFRFLDLKELASVLRV